MGAGLLTLLVLDSLRLAPFLPLYMFQRPLSWGEQLFCFPHTPEEYDNELPDE